MLEWIDEGTVLPDALRLCVVMQMHERRTAAKLVVAGEQWERDQVLRATGLGLGCGVSDRRDVGGELRRTYRLLETYDGNADEAFLRESEGLMRSSAAWAALPPMARAHDFQPSTFKLLARGRCRVRKEIEANRDYPNKLLATVKYTELRSQVQNEAACPRRLCSWSRAFIEAFPDLGSEDARMNILCSLHLWHDETARTEWGHGDLHRFVLTRSVMRKTVTLASANTFWIV